MRTGNRKQDISRSALTYREGRLVSGQDETGQDQDLVPPPSKPPQLLLLTSPLTDLAVTRAPGYTCVLLLLPSHFRRVRLCTTPWTSAHQGPLSLGFFRQEHWSELPFPSPMHESGKWKVKSESEVAQSCLTLRDPMDCSPPGSSAHGISQARVLEWVAIAFSDTCVRNIK